MTKAILTKKRKGSACKKAFTLPEVIVSFSVLIMVITSAAGILSTVIRSNGDNVSSLVAYGLAQEGIEAVRFVRDSNFSLGLDFDGVTKAISEAPFGAKLYQDGTGKAFKIVMAENVQSSCTKEVLANCLPLKLVEIAGQWEELQAGEEGRVYLKKNESGEITYWQLDDFTELEGSMFKRLVWIQPVEQGKLRVSVWVGWNSVVSNLPRQVMVSTDLTDWR